MNTQTMQYKYSTKNFHRFEGEGGISEVYVPRLMMPKPVSAISLQWAPVAGATEVPMMSKPARA